MTSRLVRSLAWIAGLLLGALQAWASRGAMNPDGVSYLDLSDRVASGDAWLPTNGYWSPLYPALLGVVRRLVSTDPSVEFQIAHAVNFALFVAAFGAFEWLLRASARHAPALRTRTGEAFAYALFLWATLRLNTLSIVTPDLLALSLVLVIGALLATLLATPPGDARTRPWPCAALGVAVGLAYLAKAAMFPLAIAFLAALALTAPAWRVGVRRGAVALAAFAVVALPFAARVSAHVGRPSFGETGRLNYAWYVNGDENPVGPTLRHPVRVLSQRPRAYEFARPVGGTYPRWFDASHWYAGLEPRLDVARQRGVLAHHARYYGRALWPLWAALAAFLVLGARRRDAVGTRAAVVLGAPAAAAFVMYALVHAEGRFLGGFAILLSLGTLATWRAPDDVSAWRALGAALAAVLCAHLLGAGVDARDALLIAGVAGTVMLGTRVAGAARRRSTGVTAAIGAVAVLAAATLSDERVLAMAAAAPWIVAVLVRPVAARVRGPRAFSIALACACALLAIVVGRRAIDHVRSLASPGDETARVAASLARAGVRAGDAVAVVGGADRAYWARRLRLRVVAEVPDEAVAEFWSASPEARRDVIARLRAAGAVAVVADPSAAGVTTDDDVWRPLGALRLAMLGERVVSFDAAARP